MLNLILSLCALAAENPVPVQPSEAPPAWKLVWQEEFNKGTAPDPKIWKHEKGYVRNQESQYYTQQRSENCRIEKGCLILEGRKEVVPNAEYKEASVDWRFKDAKTAYTSASITTKGTKEFLYGKIEVRARVPAGQGVWPAIWMLGTAGRWPACGEIDIMEFIGKNPRTIYGTLHFTSAKGHSSNGGKVEIDKLSTDFHLYTLEWDADKIDLFVDGKKYHTVEQKLTQSPDGTMPFRKPHFLLLNLALGGQWGGPVKDAVLPARFEVDYVRYYQKP
jgi:beta-glucanase (GH16 family)